MSEAVVAVTLGCRHSRSPPLVLAVPGLLVVLRLRLCISLSCIGVGIGRSRGTRGLFAWLRGPSRVGTGHQWCMITLLRPRRPLPVDHFHLRGRRAATVRYTQKGTTVTRNRRQVFVTRDRAEGMIAGV